MDKRQLLTELKTALQTGDVSEAEVRAVLSTASSALLPIDEPKAENEHTSSEKLSAVEVMFYVAGIVLFAAIMSLIWQTWDNNNPVTRILLSAGVGAGLWTVAYILHKQQNTTIIRKGLENAIILTGSLCVISGGFITTNEIIGGFKEVNFIPGALTFATLGALHIAYDRLVKKDLVLLMGILLSVGTLPATLFGILENSDITVDVDIYAGITIISALTLASASRVVAKIYPDRSKIKSTFDPLVAFVTLGAMFGASFGDYSVVWLALLVGSVFGLFYLSIVLQSKHLLGNASLFLVVSVLTISFKYFSGAGVSVSLIVAAMGLLGSAALATSINKKYFKNPAHTKNPIS
ncbi:MAG TPA: hypothetical protein VLE73_03215 [Candidatus Saccharimonadales bacterium]|nr:hypothetical protein [Candidatus Saccharimonadales bacterium]